MGSRKDMSSSQKSIATHSRHDSFNKSMQDNLYTHTPLNESPKQAKTAINVMNKFQKQ